jgi:hypothetical protein
MCNLDSIYALIVLESAALEKRLLGSMQSNGLKVRTVRSGAYIELAQDRIFEMEKPLGSSVPAFHGA